MPDLRLGVLFLTFKETVHFLYLLLDVSLQIFTSHSTSTPSAFEIFLQLTRYINYLLAYLLTSLQYHSTSLLSRDEVSAAQFMTPESLLNIVTAADSLAAVKSRLDVGPVSQT